MLNRCYRYPLVKTGIRFVAFTAGHLLLFFMLTAEFISFGKKRAFFPSNSRENPLIWTGVLARILLDAISGIHADIEVY
jgi:hypothetical protein